MSFPGVGEIMAWVDLAGRVHTAIDICRKRSEHLKEFVGCDTTTACWFLQLCALPARRVSIHATGNNALLHVLADMLLVMRCTEARANCTDVAAASSSGRDS
jgi:hypothetical protein